jgi:serine/threonine protein kinase
MDVPSHTPSEIDCVLKADPHFAAQYEIIDELGAGGTSRVFLALQRQVDRNVAIKLLLSSNCSKQSAESRFRFIKEGQILCELNHPNIIKVFSAGVAVDHPYLVMEYLRGQTLADLIKNGPLPLDRFARLFRQALKGLMYSHSHGIVHRDLKPSNLMIISSESTEELLKIVDFGIARHEAQSDGQRLTKPGALIGTPQYMSPEQCDNRPVDARTDLYALACVMYEAFVGSPPYVSDSALEVMSMHLHAAPPVPACSGSTVGAPQWRAFFAKGLTKDSNGRYQSAAEMLEDFELAVSGDKLHHAKSSKISQSGKFYYWCLSLALCLLAIVVANLEVFKLAPHPVQVASQITNYPGGDDNAFLCKTRAKTLIDDKIRRTPAERNARLNEAGRELRKALVLLNTSKHPDLSTIAEIEFSLASALNELGSDVEEEKVALSCFDHFNSSDRSYHASASRALGLAACAAFRQGHLDKEIAYLTKQIEYESLGVHPLIKAGCHRVMGDTYRQLHNYEQAQKHFTEALDLMKEESSIESSTGCEYGLAVCYLHFKKGKEARSLLEHVAGQTAPEDNIDALTQITSAKTLLESIGPKAKD